MLADIFNNRHIHLNEFKSIKDLQVLSSTNLFNLIKN